MGEKDQLRAAAQRNVLVLAAGMAALYAMVDAAVLPLLAALWISVAAPRPGSGVAEAG